MPKSKSANVIGIILVVLLLGLTIILVQPPNAAVSGVRIARNVPSVDVYCICRCDLKSTFSRRVWCCMNCDEECESTDIMACIEKATSHETCATH